MIEIIAKEEDGQLSIAVRNSGAGLYLANGRESAGMGIGLNNVKNRLRLHFGDRGSLAIHEISNDLVEATVRLPLVFAASDETIREESEISMRENQYDAQYR
jgi:LytS/YehU family sensor histidine kinase